MGVQLASVSSTTFIGPLPANNTETLVLTTGPLSPRQDSAQIILLWQCTITLGTSTTSLAYRIKRGPSTASPLVGAANWSQTGAAGNLITVGGCYVDTPGIVAGQVYSLTVQQIAATVAGVFQDGCLIALSL